MVATKYEQFLQILLNSNHVLNYLGQQPFNTVPLTPLGNEEYLALTLEIKDNETEARFISTMEGCTIHRSLSEILEIIGEEDLDYCLATKLKESYFKTLITTGAKMLTGMMGTP